MPHQRPLSTANSPRGFSSREVTTDINFLRNSKSKGLFSSAYLQVLLITALLMSANEDTPAAPACRAKSFISNITCGFLVRTKKVQWWMICLWQISYSASKLNPHSYPLFLVFFLSKWWLFAFERGWMCEQCLYFQQKQNKKKKKKKNKRHEIGWETVMKQAKSTFICYLSLLDYQYC